MTLATYVLLVEHIEGIIESSLDSGLKVRSIETLIKSVRDEREGAPDDN